MLEGERDSENDNLPAKKTLPPGQVNRSRCRMSHTSSILPRAKLRTPIWIKHEKVVATTWAVNMVRGGIFM